MNKIYGILSIMLCLFLAGCDDESKDVGPAFGIVGREVSINAAGGTSVITLTESDVKATSSEAWCTAVVSGVKVTITVTANLVLEGRTALVTLTNGVERTSYAVSQPGNRAPMPDNSTLNIEAVAGVSKIYVQSDIAFTASSKDAWLETQVEGDTLIIKVGLNKNLNKRTGTITVESGELKSVITVNQAGLVLKPAETELQVPNSAGTKTVNVTSTLAFTAASDKDWVVPTVNGKVLSLAIAANTAAGERAATVTLTSEGVTATVKVVQSLYGDFIGNWTLTGTGSDNTSLTYNIAVTKDVAGESYKVKGWGKSVVATDAAHAIRMDFDKESGLIFITAQETIGVYTDDGGKKYNSKFYGQVIMGGNTYFVQGDGYICYIGQMQANGSVKWYPGEVTLTGGVKHTVVGARYMIADQADETKVLGFNVDAPFMTTIGTSMIKAAAATSVMLRTDVSNTSKTIIPNHLMVK